MLTSSEHLTDVRVIKEFVTAGRATFTLVSKRTTKRFTFKVIEAMDGFQKPQKPQKFWVSVLTRPDTYSPIGNISGLEQAYSFKSKTYGPAADAPSVKGFRKSGTKVLVGGVDEG